MSSANPITSISGEEMRRLGIVNVGDALTQMVPANFSTYTPFAVSDTRVDGGNQDGANRGMNFIGNTIANLRGLDPAYGSRTLTMIDGKRVVSTSNQADVVDLNIIPSNLLERMDVVTGGASATYGSGAMAGVVNLVLNRRLTGINLDMDYGINEAGDGKSPHVSLSGGTPLLDGRAHVLVGLEWQDTAAIRNCAEARAWCAESRSLFSNGSATTAGVNTSPLTNQLPGYTTAPARFQMANVRYSQFNPNGVILVNGQTYATSGYRFTPDGTDVEEYSLGFRGGASGAFGPPSSVMNGDGPPVTAGTSLTAGSERKSAFSNFEYDFTPTTTGYLQARYATTEGDNKNPYLTSTNCVRFNAPGVAATPGGNFVQGSVVFAGGPETPGGAATTTNPAWSNGNFRTFLGHPTATPGSFVAPYWYGPFPSASTPVTFSTFNGNAVGRWTPAQLLGGNYWYQLISITITNPAGFSDPGNPAVLPQLGRNAYAFLNNLTPQALEQVQRGAFTIGNGIQAGAFTQQTTGPVVAYLTTSNPCAGFTPIKKVWSPQFDQYTKQNSDTWNGQVGMRGRFGGDWKWEGFYQYGQTESKSFQNNASTTIRQMFAMDAVVDDRQTVVVNGQSVANPTYGTPICRVTRDGVPVLDVSGRPVSDPAALKSLAAGCKPINIFGTSFASSTSFPGYGVNYNAAQLQQEAIDYTFVENASRGKNSLHDFSLTTNGTVWEGFGAGPLSAALGFEMRQDEVDNPGSLGAYYERFDIANGWSDKFGGRTRTTEGYLELNLPLVSGQDGINLWSINGAIRYSSIYNKGLAGTTRQSLTQTTPNWKFQTEFAPFDWVRFRLTRSQDLRAAGYRDLFINQPTPGGPDFLAGANPWRERTLESNENQQERWGTLTVGNPKLKPESSNTLTLGLVLRPGGWAQGMTMSIDYYNIRVKDGIYVSFANSDPINSCWRLSGNRAQGVNSQGQPDPSQQAINGKYDPNVEQCREVEFAQIVPTAEYDAYDVNTLDLTDIVSYNQSKPTNALPYQRRGLDLSWSYMFPLNRAFDSVPGSVSLTLRGTRALESSGSSNTTEFFTLANCRAGQTVLPCDVTLFYDLTGQIRSSNFIPGVSPSPKWVGNISASYLLGDLTTTLSARYVGGAVLDKAWCDTEGQACFRNEAGQYLAGSVDDNSVDPYVNFSLNASYNLKIANLKQFQVFGSVNNLFDKSPPWTAGYVSGASPSFNDTLGRAYRMGVRLKF